MAFWIVKFDDTPGILKHRKQFGDQTILQYLKGAMRIKSWSAVVFEAGTRCAPFVWRGLWIVDAENHDEVVDLVLSDPYFAPEHRRFEIFAWGKAIDVPVTI